jgi:replication initiator protein A
VYRVARKHAGGAGEEGFAISLPTLFEKSGAEGTYRRFKFEMQAIVRHNDLPGFDLSLQFTTSREPSLRMCRRAVAHAEGEPGRRRAASATQPTTEPRQSLQLFSHRLTDETLARVRRDFPMWDVYAIKAEFDAWLADNDKRRPDDYQAAFYGFMRRHDAKNHHPGRAFPICR